MTDVLVDLSVPDPSGVDAPAEGVLYCTPTRRRDVDGRVVLPASFSVDLVGGVAVLPLAPTGPTWCWQVQESARLRHTRFVVVPDSATPVLYTDLVDVDPATLEPSEASVPAWEAAVGAVQALADGVAVEASGAATHAATATGGATVATQAAAVAEAAKADTLQAAAVAMEARDEAVSARDTAVPAAAAAVAARDAALAASTGALSLAAQSSIRTQRERMAKGGVVGVGDRGVVVFRWDDWQDALRAVVWPLFVARGLPAGHVLISRFATAQPWGAGTTWDDIRSWTKQGIEIWCHGTDHRDPSEDGDAGIYREIVTAKHEIEAQGVKVMGFAPPGTTPLGAGQPFGTKWDSPEAYDTYAGQLIQANYGISDGYLTGKYRKLPHGIYHGVSASTANLTDGTSTKAEMIAAIDRAVSRKLCITLFGHAGNLGRPDGPTLADLIEVLDYVVALRDTGALDVLTPSSAYFASQDTERRLELYQGGTFEDAATGDARWFQGWGSKTVETTGGRGGGRFLRIPTVDSGTIYQMVDGLGRVDLGVDGEVFMFEAWVKSVAGASVVRLRVDDVLDAGKRPVMQKDFTITADTWTLLRFPFSLYVGQPSARLGIARRSGSGTSLDVDDVRVYKV